MKKLLLCIICLMLIIGCQAAKEKTETKEKRENETWQHVAYKTLGTRVFIPVQSVKEITSGEANFDNINKTLLLHYGGNQYFFIYNVPVVQKNGLFLPGQKDDFQIISGEAWLSKRFINDTLGLNVRVASNQAFIEKMKRAGHRTNNEVTTLSPLGSVDNVREIMGGLQSPIKKAQVDTIPSHLPGAKRAYRNGVHEGMDWYGFSTGVPMNRKTEVYAMATGVVVRADHEYNRYLSREERSRDLKDAAEIGFTPAYMLDRLRGRQVWVQYENGLQARFAHLDRIPEDLNVGDTVTADYLIGYVGNSGTSGDVKKDDSELHLHLDLLYRGELFWKGLTEKEIEKIVKTVFKS
ncbi:M23 family metallopeptidase [Schinkia sp. CFF1]